MLGLIVGPIAAFLAIGLLSSAIRLKSWEYLYLGGITAMNAVAAFGNFWFEFSKTFP